MEKKKCWHSGELIRTRRCSICSIRSCRNRRAVSAVRNYENSQEWEQYTTIRTRGIRGADFLKILGDESLTLGFFLDGLKIRAHSCAFVPFDHRFRIGHHVDVLGLPQLDTRSQRRNEIVVKPRVMRVPVLHASRGEPFAPAERRRHFAQQSVRRTVKAAGNLYRESAARRDAREKFGI